MAGVVGSATGAAVTAIVMIFEMTLDYQVILPMTVTVAISYGIRRFLLKDSVYTLKLARRGHPMPEALQANSWQVRQARDYMDSRLAAVSVSATLDSLAQSLSDPACPRWFLVEEQGKLVGVIEAATLADLIQRSAGLSLREAARQDYEVVGELTAFFELLSRTRARQPGLFLVASQTSPVLAQNIKGVISKERVTETMLHAIAPAPE